LHPTTKLLAEEQVTALIESTDPPSCRASVGEALVWCDHEVTTMPKLKNVGVREFRDHATTYLSGSDPVAVSKHGQVIGFYIPVEGDREQARRAIERLGRSVEEILEETGMTEDELAQLFDLRRALPE
jgi:hypothetical protein